LSPVFAWLLHLRGALGPQFSGRRGVLVRRKRLDARRLVSFAVLDALNARRLERLTLGTLFDSSHRGRLG
jgi:hypothetical protein